MKRSTLSDKKAVKILAPLAFWLAVWAVAAKAVGTSLLIPSPLEVLRTLGELAATALFWKSTGLSLLRIFCGGACGILLGTALAVLTFRFRVCDLLLSPVLRLIRATPVASFILLVLLWVKTGFVPAVISCLMVTPLLWQSVSDGIRAADPQLVELGKAYHLTAWRKLRGIYLPGAMPCFTTGVCNAVGLSWKAGIAAEVLCTPKAAIGTQVYFSKLYLETPSLFAWTAVVLLLSMGIEALVRLALKKYGGQAK